MPAFRDEFVLRKGSALQRIARYFSDRLLAPGARVVKAFNHMTVPNLEADPIVNGARQVAFVSADDAPSKKRVEILLEELGYAVIDLGSLRDGGLTQQSGGPLAGRDLMERGEYRKKGDPS